MSEITHSSEFRVPLGWVRYPEKFELLIAYIEMSERMGVNWNSKVGGRLRLKNRSIRTLTRVLTAYAPELTTREVAQQAGVATCTVSNYIALLKEAGWLEPSFGRFNKLKKQKRQEIRDLFLEGLSPRQIKSRVGRSQGEVYRVINTEIEKVGVTLSQAAQILNRSLCTVTKTVIGEGVPRFHWKESRINDEGLAELKYLLNCEEKICPVCDQPFIPKTRTSTMCSRECSYKRNNERRHGSRYTTEPDPALLRGWIKQLYDALHSTPMALTDRWVEYAEALKISGLTPMRLRHLMQTGVIYTRLHPTKTWKAQKSNQPIRVCLVSELKLAKKVYKSYTAKSR